MSDDNKKELGNIHWCVGVEGWPQALDLCEDCANEIIEEAKKRNPDKAEDFILDGGWGLHTSDGPASCSKCEKPLASQIYGGETIETMDEWLRADMEDDFIQ